VHLIHGELFDELGWMGGPVRPGGPVAVEVPPSPHEALDRV
jgi:hypothetical protein